MGGGCKDYFLRRKVILKRIPYDKFIYTYIFYTVRYRRVMVMGLLILLCFRVYLLRVAESTTTRLLIMSTRKPGSGGTKTITSIFFSPEIRLSFTILRRP